MNPKSKLADPVKGNSLLVRPLFSPGLLLNDDDLTAGVDYTRELSRLMFRTLFGCGVMCGLVVSAEIKCGTLHIRVADGVALDCHGDPVQVPTPQSIPLDATCGVAVPKTLWVMLRKSEKCCSPRGVSCATDDEDSASVCTRARDGFELRVVAEPPKCACGCPDADRTQDPIDPIYTGDSQLDAILTGTNAAATPRGREDCRCVDPTLPCYHDHYAGICSCGCSEGGDCHCEWIVLARLTDNGSEKQADWLADHSVRRFVRPVLMRDPQVDIERNKAKEDA